VIVRALVSKVHRSTPAVARARDISTYEIFAAAWRPRAAVRAAGSAVVAIGKTSWTGGCRHVVGVVAAVGRVPVDQVRVTGPPGWLRIQRLVGGVATGDRFAVVETAAVG
jgi:hypothetical protein